MTDPLNTDDELDPPPIVTIAISKEQLNGRIDRIRRYMAGDSVPSHAGQQSQWENWGNWGNFANFVEFPDK